MEKIASLPSAMFASAAKEMEKSKELLGSEHPLYQILFFQTIVLRGRSKVYSKNKKDTEEAISILINR
jgi:hypothetical protein